jgi:hypothetical protein
MTSEETTIEFIESYVECEIQAVEKKMRALLAFKSGIELDMQKFCDSVKKILEEKKLEIGQFITFIYEPYHAEFEIYDGYVNFLTSYLSEVFRDYDVCDLLHPMLSKSYKFRFTKL